MALSEIDQIKKTIERANSILVTFVHDETHDAPTSAVALALVLKKMGKRVEVVAHEWQAPNELSFLPAVKTIKPSLENLQKFVIEVEVSATPVKELSYDVRDGKLRIALVSKTGNWKPDDVRAKNGDYRFDLICTVGVPELASLGVLFERNADFFYHVPIVNFDHHPANEHYGQINHVDINATANGELLFALVAQIDRHLIDEEIATALLAGMIGKTKSFKTPNVTPKTLQAASELVTMGARREEIVHHFYRTRTVPVLRLWGRALARLKHDSACKLVWTVLTRQDFVMAGADPSVLPGVIDELIINAPEARVAAILYEDPTQNNGKGVVGLIHAERPLRAHELAASFGANSTRDTVRIELKDKTLVEAEPLVTEKLKERLVKLTRG